MPAVALGLALPEIASAGAVPRKPREYSILDLGAVADGKTLNTPERMYGEAKSNDLVPKPGGRPMQANVQDRSR